MTASMPHAANDSGGSEVSSCEIASAAVKPHRGTGVFMPRPAAGSSMVPQRPQAASTATQLQLQQGMRRSYSGSGSSLPWPGTQQQPFGGPTDNSNSCRSCSLSGSIAVPQSSRAGATPPRHGTGTSSSSNCNSVIPALPENPYLTHHHLQHHSAPLAHPVAVQYAAAAAAALAGALDDDLDDTLCLPGGALGFSELSDGVLGASPGACSDDLAFGPASLPGGYSTLAGNSHALAGNSFTAAAELNSSLAQLPGSSYSQVSMHDLLGSSVSAAPAQWPHSKAFEQQQQQQVQPSRTLSTIAGSGSFNGRNSSSNSSMQRGQWPASSPLPQPLPAAAAAVSRQSSRGSGQMLLSQTQQSTSLSNNNQGFWYAQQQLEASSDQMLGSSYQQQQLLLHQQMQQMLAGSIAGGAADADANVYLTECSSPGGTCAPAGLMPSSSLGMPGQQQQQQQQQQQVRLQRRSTMAEPPLLWPSALEQQLHSQIGSSSSSSALQPLVHSSSGGSQELQTVHAINAQLEQLLKLKEDVLAAKASVQGLQLPAVSAAAMSPLPPASPLPTAAAATAPAYMAAAITNTRYADLLPDLARMSSLPEQLQHLDYQPQQQQQRQQQQQQQLFSAPDLQQQQQQQYVLGSSLGSAGFITPSAFQLALGNSMQDFAPPAAASAAADLPLHRSSSSGRTGQRLVGGSWSGGECCSSSGGLPAIELARQKHAVRAATEQKLQQLAALQRMQSDLQEELMHMLQ